jgi:transcriptional regulator with XRE-family HTH domain
MTKRNKEETTTARKIKSAPHAGTPLCRFLTKQIAAISGVKSQREIAAEAGYEMPNILSMIKNGDTKLPLDKVPALAKALGVDPKHLFRLTIEQHHPEVARVAHEIFGNVVTDNEMALVRMLREVSDDVDPKPAPALLDLMENALKTKHRSK